MSDLSQRQRISSLLECYEKLLSPVQREIAGDYYWFDLSMSEIAESRKISKAAVKDALDKALAKLEECETALGLLEQRKQTLERLNQIDSLPDSKKLDAFLELEKEYRHGI